MKPTARIQQVSVLVGIVATSAILVASCAASPHPMQGGAVDVITYVTEQGPFCGRCETLKLVVQSDGVLTVERGHWAGSYRDWQVRRQMLRVTPEQLANFWGRLAPHRPSGVVALNSSEGCREVTEDLPQVSVVWSGPNGTDRLDFAFGCDSQSRAAMREALRDAPLALGLEGPLASRPPSGR